MVKRCPTTYLLLFLLLAVLLAPRDTAATGQSPRKVLLLTSYHQGDRWNDSVVQGVREALGSLESVSLSIENLDMRRYTDQAHTRLITEYIQAKYHGRPQDLVLVSDDPALNFLLTVRDDLFPTSPVVFCGVNNFSPKRIQGQPNITGVNETLSLEATLELALKLFPRTTRVMAVVSDTDASARTNLELYRALAGRMKGRVHFAELLNMTGNDAPDILSHLPKDSLILRLTTLLKPEGGYLSIEGGSRILSAYASVPVFTAWSFDLGDCALGGYVSSGQDQGREAGNLAIRILEGEGADHIPVVMDSPNVPMFDYKLMERFGIKESALPKGSVVLNHQVSVLEQYWGWLLGIAFFCGLQTFLILALLTRGKSLREANAALRESEQSLRTLSDSGMALIWTSGTDKLCNYFNTTWLEFTGRTLEEETGNGWTEGVHPDDFQRCLDMYVGAFDRQEKFSMEYRLRWHDGTYRWLVDEGCPRYDSQGEFLGYIGHCLDITDRKRDEEDLSHSYELMSYIIKHNTSALAVHDKDLKYLFVSERYLDDYKVKDRDVIGKHHYDVFPDLPQKWRDVHQKALAGITLSAKNDRYDREDGSVEWTTWECRPWYESNGEVGGFVVYTEVVTDRIKAEEQKILLHQQLHQAQKMEAIGTLAGGIAHDFNNILGAIVGYAEMIRDDFPPGSPSIHDINQVLKASHRAKNLVKQILAFSRQMEGQKVPMQPAVVVKEALTLLRSSIPTTITINQDIDLDAGMILADPTQFHQIVMNLATNAFHAMEVKGGTLTISLRKRILTPDDLATEPDLQQGNYVQLSVRDSGEGIPTEIQERIFDPFFTTKEVGKGTGLGLSMVYSIVKRSGGSISCDSRLSEGTEFRIILPALEGHTVQENGSSELTPHGQEHILLIDDEEMLAELGQAMLERLGYHVTTRRSSLDALTTFQNQPDAFDLIITDQTMPGMTGVDLARRILQIRPGMPIILCTGYSSLITEDKAKAAGIKGFALKPLAKKGLAILIRKVLQQIGTND